MRNWLVNGMVFVMSCTSLVATSLAGDSRAKSPDSPSANVKRIVLLKFKDGTSPEKVRELNDGIRALRAKIPAIASLDVAANTNTQNLSEGFTHIVFLTFKSRQDRAAFLSDATHKRYEKEVLDPYLDKVLLVEFTSSGTP